MALGIGAWLLNPRGYLLIGCNQSLIDVIRLQLSDQSLFLARRAASISVKVCAHSPVLGKHTLSWYRAGSLIKVPFNHRLLFEQPLGLSGSGFDLARSSSLAPIPFCYMCAYVVTPINMFCSY